MYKILLTIKNKIIKVGLTETIFLITKALLKKVGIEIIDPVIRRQLQLSSEINILLKSTVSYGPFKGLKLSKDIWWGKTDRANMLLGLYEQEITAELMNLPSEYNIFIDIGAADGYYGLGVVVGKLFSKSHCFEINKKGQDVIANSAIENGISSHVTIHGAANSDFLDRFSDDDLSKSVLLIDIEGGEFELLNKASLRRLKNSIIFIELHNKFLKNSDAILQRLKFDSSEYFTSKEFTTTSRDLSKFPELREYCDTDRWLIASEGRPFLMSWIRFDPKLKEL